MSAAASAPGSARALASEPTAIGEQCLVPGIAPIDARTRLALRADAPLQPRKAQRPLDIGLFDLAARNQLDLFNPLTSAPPSGAD